MLKQNQLKYMRIRNERRRKILLILLAVAVALLIPERPLIPEQRLDFDSLNDETCILLFRYNDFQVHTITIVLHQKRLIFLQI